MLELGFKPERIRNVFLFFVLFLTLAHIGARLSAAFVGQEFPLLDMDGEANIPSLYSAFAIFFCAILFFIIFRGKKKHDEPFRYHWLILSMVFLLMCADEALELHERVTNIMRPAFQTTGVLYSAWIIPYSLFAVVFAILFLPFLLHLPSRIRRLFIAAGAVYMAGAVGFEVLGEMLSEQRLEHTFAFQFFLTMEETLEMLGMVIQMYAALLYIALDFKEVRFNLTSGELPADLMSNSKVVHLNKRKSFPTAGER